MARKILARALDLYVVWRELDARSGVGLDDEFKEHRLAAGVAAKH
jgi:hypothetical protein